MTGADREALGPLVSVAGLHGELGEPHLRIVDCRWYLGEPDRGRAEYTRGHIPGAAYFSLDDDLSAPAGPGRHPLPEPAASAAHFGNRGIGAAHTVVAYDDRGGAVAARLWWMLRRVGHRRVAVLDGGLTAWRSAGLGEDRTEPFWAPTELPVRPPLTSEVDRDDLRRAVGSRLLLDARSADRYRGENEPVDPVAGHIPTARNAPYDDNLETDQRLLPGSTLAARYGALGVEGGDDVIVYCGSGVTACLDILALRVAGFGEPALYPGSWSDWSTAGYPVAVGEEPGTPA